MKVGYVHSEAKNHNTKYFHCTEVSFPTESVLISTNDPQSIDVLGMLNHLQIVKCRVESADIPGRPLPHWHVSVTAEFLSVSLDDDVSQLAELSLGGPNPLISVPAEHLSHPSSSLQTPLLSSQEPLHDPAFMHVCTRTHTQTHTPPFIFCLYLSQTPPESPLSGSPGSNTSGSYEPSETRKSHTDRKLEL